MKNIYKQALMKMSEKDIDHYNSDLYLKVNSISKKLIQEYNFKKNVETFVDEIDHELWYDIPFAYLPFYKF